MLDLFIALTLQAAAPRVASDLHPGLLLHYTSGPQFTSPWIVDSAEVALALMPGADCARFRIRRNADQVPNESRLCVLRDTLFGWDTRRNTWTPQRPVGPHMTFIQARANGDTVRYTTETRTSETVSGIQLVVLPTTVLTVDSLGRPKRRLRERYALSIATAVGGVFEVPDPDTPGAWRPEQRFELARLEPRTR
ncbi:MAG: hypothetical protein ACT4P6_02340 [Gemmatimonadaceae bacterium]